MKSRLKKWKNPVSSKLKMVIHNGPFEDVFPLEHGDIPLLRGVNYQFKLQSLRRTFVNFLPGLLSTYAHSFRTASP